MRERAFEGLQESMEKGLLHLHRHLSQVILYDALEGLTDDPVAELVIAARLVKLIEKLGPLLHVLIDELLQVSLCLHEVLLG